MRLRTKLTLGIVAVTFATFVVFGFVVVPAMKHALRDRVDERLVADLPQVDAATITPDGQLDLDVLKPAGQLGDRDYAVLLVDQSGSATVLARSGPVDGPDAPPELTDATELADAGQVADIRAVDGTSYRYATIALDDGRVLVVAAPIDDVVALGKDVINTLWLFGLPAAAVIGALSWWWVRRSTRAIERLAARADAIADGDPDRSLAIPTRTLELRQLSGALDAMMTSIDSALAAREASETRLRDFVADASHELRTPLAAVSGYLQLDVSGQFDGPPEHDRAIRRALGEADRMSRIVADLQQLSELDRETPMTITRVDVGALVHDAVDAARAGDPSRTWRYEGPDEACAVHGDADRLRQVIDNALANVRVHTPPGTTATTRLQALERDVVIEVTDDGPGLPSSALSRVFDRFWRHDRSRSRTSGGSGLGLAIAAGIVSAHHGHIEATSIEGQGLTITITLPSASGGGRDTERSIEQLGITEPAP